MKKKIYLFAILFMALSFVACGGDDGEEVITNDLTLNTTVWSYKSSDFSHVEKTFEEKENFHQLEALLEQCPSIPRTVSNNKSEKTTSEIDLCEGHGSHSSITMKFNGANCHFVDSDVRYIQEVKKITETSDYIFTAGSYMGYSDNSYYTYTVKSYGIYKTTVEGDICVLPLDGNFTYNVKEITYESQVTTSMTDNSDANLTYQRNGNNIKLQGNGIEISGTIESNPSRMFLQQTKPTEKSFTLTN